MKRCVVATSLERMVGLAQSSGCDNRGASMIAKRPPRKTWARRTAAQRVPQQMWMNPLRNSRGTCAVAHGFRGSDPRHLAAGCAARKHPWSFGLVRSPILRRLINIDDTILGLKPAERDTA
jgi:hypothetical protein